jgi:membrane carboxypeptidase/penicillin-binding protein
MGIESRLPAVASLALGTGGVTLLELTSAYGVFANQGSRVSPHLIVRVEDKDGRRSGPRRRATARRDAGDRVPHEQHAGRRDQLGHGDGRARGGLQAAGRGQDRNGDNYTDAWFIGYTPHLVTGVWFGMDRPAPIMNRGFAAVVAVPAWASS